MARPVMIQHGTSLPYQFFGRQAELALLDAALAGDAPSLVALVGPGGQGKTAIAQHWLERNINQPTPAPGENDPARLDGVFLWSFYRGKDADLCLRALYAYAEGLAEPPEVSASYCVDRLLPVLRRERWAIVLDGTEVAQYEAGEWRGRFYHPELGRFLEELAAEPTPGVAVITSRFELPTLRQRRHARLIELSRLDQDSACALLASLGVRGERAGLERVSAAAGRHAKAVELLGTYLVRFHEGRADDAWSLPATAIGEDASDEERHVAQVMAAYQARLPAEAQDIIALATAFRDPPSDDRLREYLTSAPVQTLLRQTWGRDYPPFAERPAGWLAAQVNDLVALRLLERVGRPGMAAEEVIDAHPLVRRSFEHMLGAAGRRESARTRAGFLRGRPDRRRPATLEEAREEVELFHSYCDAGLWNEADSTLVALENPKHRFLAPALERDLLLRFFPNGDWRQRPLWSGFGRWRSLAICFEMLGQFGDALAAYPEADAALRGDAWIALGQLDTLLNTPSVTPPWDTLWRAYRCHALVLAGRVAEGVALARSLVPVDVYEWVHVFECLLRADRLDAIDLKSVLFRPPHAQEHRWADLARRRMRADYLRRTAPDTHLDQEYRELLEAYDQAGLPYERVLTRLGYLAWLRPQGRTEEARSIAAATRELARSHAMQWVEADLEQNRRP